MRVGRPSMSVNLNRADATVPRDQESWPSTLLNAGGMVLIGVGAWWVLAHPDQVMAFLECWLP